VSGCCTGLTGGKRRRASAEFEALAERNRRSNPDARAKVVAELIASRSLSSGRPLRAEPVGSHGRSALAARTRPSFCSPPRSKKIRRPAKEKGGGAPKGASNRCPRGAVRCCHLRALRARKRPDVGGRSPSGAPTAALAGATERSRSAQAALRAKERTQALPAPSIALKRSTPRPGHSAGGDDARAARERSYELRPQEPHPLRQSAVTGDVPRTSGHFQRNTNEDLSQ